MTHFHAPDSTGSPSSSRPRISWAAVVGFGALALIWPVLHIVGIEAAIGGPATAIIAFLTVAAVWVLGAGFGRVPRPVLTLTLSGVLFGIVLVASSMLMGQRPDYGPWWIVVGAVIEIGRSAGLGALAGLAASGIQKARRD